MINYVKHADNYPSHINVLLSKDRQKGGNMPIYFNVPTHISGNLSDYNSGVIHRRSRTIGGGHREAPMDVSGGLIRYVGPGDYDCGLEAGLAVKQYAYCSGYYVCTYSAKTQSRYSSITLDLYTVHPKADLTKRTDAVLVRNCDRNRVKVLSGGGYDERGVRCCDNIFLRVRVPAIIVIQRRRELESFTPHDYFYLVTREGVREIMAARGDDTSPLMGVSSNIKEDWEYI